MKTVNCSVKEEFGKISKCEIEVRNGNTGINFDAQVSTNISTMFLRYTIYTERRGKLMPIVELKDVNLCKLLSTDDSSGFSRLAAILKDVFASKGNLPKKCPVLDGTKLAFQMLNLDPNSFPFLPEMEFQVDMLLNANSIPNVIITSFTGQIINLRRSAGRK